MATPTPNQQLEALFSESQQNSFQSQGLTAAYVYLGFGVPSVDGYTFLINNNDATDFGAGAGGPVFNQENVYINSFVNLVTGNTTAAANFATILGGATTLSAALTAVYNSMVPVAEQNAAGRAFFLSEASFYTARAAQVGLTTLVGQATVAAAALANILVNNNVPGLGQEINQFTNAVANGTAVVPQDGSLFTPILTAIGTGSGLVFTLTTGIDNIVSNGAFDAVLGSIATNGPAGTPISSTLNPGDQIAMAGGTLKIVDLDTTNGNGTFNELAGVNITGPFQLSVQEISFGNTWNLAGYTATAVTSNNSIANGVNFTNVTTGASVNVSGTGSAAGNTTFFSMATPNAPVTIGFGGVSSQTIVETAGAPTALTLNSTGLPNGSAGKADTFTGAGGGAIATVTVNASTNFFGGFNNAADFVAAGAALTVSGAATAVDLTEGAAQGIYATIDASGLSGGGLTVQSDSVLTSFIGGGGGNNVLEATGVGAISAAATSIDGGPGTNNTVSGLIVNLGNGAIFHDWQNLDITGFTGGTVDAAVMTANTGGISGVVIDNLDTGGITATVQHLNSAATLTDNAAGMVDTSVTLTHLTGTANTLAITINDTSAATADVIGSVVSTGDATVSITSGGLNPLVFNAIDSYSETDNNLTGITIGGTSGFELTAVHTDAAALASGLTTSVASSLTSINASGNSGGVEIIAGATDTNGIGGSVTYTGLSITGSSSGIDFIENDAASGTITLGNGGTSLGATTSATVTNNAETVNFGTGFDNANVSQASLSPAFIAGSTAQSVTMTGAVSGHETINFVFNTAATITDFTSSTLVTGAPSIVAAEGNVANAVGANGIGYFTFGGNEFIVATGATPTTGGPVNNFSLVGDDAVVKLIGGAFHHNTVAVGIVTLVA